MHAGPADASTPLLFTPWPSFESAGRIARAPLFADPIDYGMRSTVWIQSTGWGLGFDYTHARRFADLSLRAGEEPPPPVASAAGPWELGDSLRKLQFTQVHNLVTLNGIYRWLPPASQRHELVGRLQPYAGLGAGVAIPRVAAPPGDGGEYELSLAAPAAQGMAGILVELTQELSVFGEYRLSYASIEAETSGLLEQGPWTNRFLFGLSFGF